MKNILNHGIAFCLSLLLMLSIGTMATAATEEYKYTETEGNEQYEKFLNAVEVLKEEQYSAGLKILGMKTPLTKWIVENGYFTEDEWSNMSEFERMCYTSTYFDFCFYYETNGDYNFSEIEILENKVLRSVDHLAKLKHIPTEAQQAFHDIFKWQYNYYLANDDFYNFIDHDKYSDHIEHSEVIETPYDDDVTTDIAKESETKKVKTNLMEKLWHNAYLIAIGAVLGGIWASLVHKRKKKNREDTMNEK